MYNENCEDCKSNSKKRSSVESRVYSLKYAMEDYDRMKGKGAFKKKHPDGQALLEKLMDQKVELAIDHASHAHKEPEEKSDAPEQPTASVPVY